MILIGAGAQSQCFVANVFINTTRVSVLYALQSMHVGRYFPVINPGGIDPVNFDYWGSYMALKVNDGWLGIQPEENANSMVNVLLTELKVRDVPSATFNMRLIMTGAVSSKTFSSISITNTPGTYYLRGLISFIANRITAMQVGLGTDGITLGQRPMTIDYHFALMKVELRHPSLYSWVKNTAILSMESELPITRPIFYCVNLRLLILENNAVFLCRGITKSGAFLEGDSSVWTMPSSTSCIDVVSAQRSSNATNTLSIRTRNSLNTGCVYFEVFLTTQVKV